MSNAERYHFADFTRDSYRQLLRLARKTYVFRGYTDFRLDERFVLWRHDLDSSVHAARALARIEAEEGLATTHFVRLHSEFYNLFERDSTDCVREIVALGHAIGLHFESEFYGLEDEAALDAALARERRILEDLLAVPVTAFAFHLSTPLALRARHAHYAGLVNATADYFRTEVGYCSDSNGYWRFRRLEDVLTDAGDERLQVLTHPEYWPERAMSPHERIHRCIDGRAEHTRRFYAGHLATWDRPDIDWT
jgi:hypothetical protein